MKYLENHISIDYFLLFIFHQELYSFRLWDIEFQVFCSSDYCFDHLQNLQNIWWTLKLDCFLHINHCGFWHAFYNNPKFFLKYYHLLQSFFFSKQLKIEDIVAISLEYYQGLPIRQYVLQLFWNYCACLPFQSL